ncbi:unnamed protein product [Cladocopium goreaui]|uniref:Uncharacterized protein n=1 Tax=Cladocopium goreaui TaxID=2562237 RepID=A0A9P1FE71_9DINO|nr:unnamed protein product [Cladocopium goreaui]|mmetsp:Transcript_57865/g.126574  ORF Transcript_57865/g.126574 Transcript_57865/m.126574 type:complete len:127 (-) Transcript_57865:21-401(-)
MGNNCCATSDAEGGEVTVNKSVKVSDMVESLHSSVASADQSLIEKLEGTVWVRKSDGNPMARIERAQVIWDESFKSANSSLSSNGTNVLVMNIRDKEKSYSFSGEVNLSAVPMTIIWSDGDLWVKK